VERSQIKSFNCLADEELRSGIKEYRWVSSSRLLVPLSCPPALPWPCERRSPAPQGVYTRSRPVGLTCSDWPTIPQVYIKGEFVGGADIMYSSGFCDLTLVVPN
jgi:monothiol glutaredoxin